MRRNENLQPLSRDHHYGLLLGWKIRQGIKFQADPEIIAGYVTWFSLAALFPHFEEEENEVLAFLPDSDAHKQRTLREHGMIRTMIAAIAAEVSSEKLLALADLLDTHIRFEERELFPYLETSLSASDLERIGAAVSLQHKPFVDNYAHEFWERSGD